MRMCHAIYVAEYNIFLLLSPLTLDANVQTNTFNVCFVEHGTCMQGSVYVRMYIN